MAGHALFYILTTGPGLFQLLEALVESNAAVNAGKSDDSKDKLAGLIRDTGSIYVTDPP